MAATPWQWRPALLACLTLTALAGAAAARAGSPATALSCSVVLDIPTGKVLAREGTCDQRFTPASTFKVPLAIIGFEHGVITGPHEPAITYDGRFEAPERDRRTVDPTSWLADSVVWYSREIVRRSGKPYFPADVGELDYGNADVSGDPGKDNGTTNAWLSSSLLISPDEQAAFQRNLVLGRLKVPAETLAAVRAIVPTFPAGVWTIHGKTGSIWLRDASGRYDRTKPVGWFVGWAEAGKRQVAFARFALGAGPVEGSYGRLLRDALIAEMTRSGASWPTGARKP